MTPQIRPLTETDYAALRDIRLEALRRHPEAFCADLAVEEAMPKEAWLSRLASAVTFGGFDGDELEAMAVYARPSSEKLSHIGNLAAMYVREAARGKGFGDGLVRAVVERASSEVEQIKLTVNADNAHAVRLYERHGFRTAGRIARSIHVGQLYFDELIMLRTVSPSD